MTVRSFVVVVRAVLAIAILAAGAWIVAGLPTVDGPTQRQFILMMILPPLGALALAPRTIRFAFLAGAAYALLAGLRRLWAPEGNATAAEQLSTAAIVALLIPIAGQFWRWTGGRVLAAAAKRSRVE
jgi:hypothetical protein